MLTAFSVLQIAIVVAAPLVLGSLLARRWPLSWATFGAGAVSFVGSQVVHIPLNAVLGPVLAPGGRVAAVAIVAPVVGLSAGVCEELARYGVLRFWRTKERTGAHALMFGAGHGGCESILVGGMGLLALFNLVMIQRLGVENLGLDPVMQNVVRQQLLAAAQTPWIPLVGALERLMVIPFHVAASCLVMLAVQRRQPLYLLAAIAWHTVLDAGVVATGATLGPWAAECWVAVVFAGSLPIIRSAMRALPSLDRAVSEPRPASSGEPLELVRAVKTFGEVRALDGISFTIKRGERACLLGPNGAGKTTSIRLATGALAPTRGFAFVFGVAARDEGFLAAKRRVGIVPQQPGMYESMTVRAYLELVRELYAAKEPDGVATRLGLEPYMDRPTSELSGGMQRRLSLAAALMSHPDLLILDEPSAGLDPVASHEMIECLKEASADRTTLLCTHNLAEAEELCDSVVILRSGKVLVHAPLAELRERAPARLALRAVQGAPRLKKALEDRGLSATLDEGDVSIPIADPEHNAPALLRELLAEGLDLYECRVLRPTLEDLFLHFLSDAARASAPPAAPPSATPASVEEPS